ncbi:MAG TPA: GlsB/YeaQ/YmgE family stress response membrane protein [Anaerolineales bacterium]|nr:GlsB/YeaQ/YmgE family stress response membrane protein [Anaerolineales bacterium]
MTLVGFLIYLLIVAVVGALGQAIAGYTLGGCLVSMVVGFIGAIIGQWMAQSFGLPLLLPVTVEGQTIPIVWATLGSAIFTGIASLLLRRRVIYLRR